MVILHGGDSASPAERGRFLETVFIVTMGGGVLAAPRGDGLAGGMLLNVLLSLWTENEQAPRANSALA